MKNALLIFVKNLIEGKVKTRLSATVGNRRAMEIYRQLLHQTKINLENVAPDKIVFYSDFIEEDIWEVGVFKKEIQHGIDLGNRMENALALAFKSEYSKVVIIGTDCPGINKEIFDSAFLNLDKFDIVIGPATDGGYYLLGMQKVQPFLFQDIHWSTDSVLSETIQRCKANNLSYFLLPELTDIDEEKDLAKVEISFDEKH